jgi:sugar phosphate isomerase/epimerase
MAQLSFATLNHSPFVTEGVSLPDQFAAAAAAGFELVGPDIFSLRTWRDDGRSYEELADALHASNVGCSDIAGVAVTGKRESTLAESEEMLAFAQPLGCEWMQVRVTKPVDDDIRALFVEVCKLYGDAGMGIAIEWSPYTPLNSIAGSRELVAAGKDFARVGVIVDTWHFFHGGDSWPELDALPIDELAMVQFTDGLPAGDDRAATMNRRAIPGEGELDLTTFVDKVRARGFDGLVSLEVLSEHDRGRNVEDFARACYTASMRYWG